jgi:hypothetical protein
MFDMFIIALLIVVQNALMCLSLKIQGKNALSFKEKGILFDELKFKGVKHDVFGSSRC